MATPNIFSCVTSERLQDAFVCYLVACANQTTSDRDLQECGLEFVRTLFRAGASNATAGVPVLDPDGEPMDPYVGPCKVSEVYDLKPQYKVKDGEIDVYFQAKVDGKKVAFIIENKIHTSEHDNQLARYLNSVSKDEQDLIKAVYFKTGYVFSDERAFVECNKYSVFEAEDMKKFLAGQVATKKDEILRQYAEHLENLIETRDEDLTKWDLDPVRWEFMLKLREKLEDAADDWQCFICKKFSGLPKDDDIWKEKGLKRKNEWGGMWMEYWFSKYLFWRIDPKTKKNLRLMIALSNAKLDYDLDYEVVRKEYRSCFEEVLSEKGVSGKARGNKGAFCTVGFIDIPEFQEKTVSDFLEGKAVSKFLDRVKRVHIGFLKKMQQRCESTQ